MKKIITNRNAITIAVLFLASFGISLIGINNGHDWGGDFSQYIAQARAIDFGTIDEWQQKNEWIINNSSAYLGANAYPWLFPILIAPIYHFAGLNYLSYKVFLSFVFSICIVSFYYFLRKKEIRQPIAIMLCVILLLNREYLMLCKMVLSDIPCLLFTIVSWIAIDWYIKDRTWKKALVTGVISFLPFFTRTTGIVVIVSLFIVDVTYILKVIISRELKKKTIAIVGLPYLMWIICWIIIGIIFPKAGSSYMTYFSTNLQHVSDNIYYYKYMVLEFIYQGIFVNGHWVRGLSLIIIIPLASVVVIGFIKCLLDMDYLALYVLITMGMLLLYNSRQSTRFIISVFPLLLLFGYYGSKIVIHSQKSKVCAITIGLCFFILTIGCSLINIYNTIREKPVSMVDNEAALELYDYIDSEVSEDDIVFFMKPRVLYLYTDVLSYALYNRESLTIQDMDKADYILQAKSVPFKALDKLIEDNSSVLKIVFENDDFKLYEYVK